MASAGSPIGVKGEGFLIRGKRKKKVMETGSQKKEEETASPRIFQGRKELFLLSREKFIRGAVHAGPSVQGKGAP